MITLYILAALRVRIGNRFIYITKIILHIPTQPPAQSGRRAPTYRHPPGTPRRPRNSRGPQSRATRPALSQTRHTYAGMQHAAPSRVRGRPDALRWTAGHFAGPARTLLDWLALRAHDSSRPLARDSLRRGACRWTGWHFAGTAGTSLERVAVRWAGWNFAGPAGTLRAPPL